MKACKMYEAKLIPKFIISVQQLMTEKLLVGILLANMQYS